MDPDACDHLIPACTAFLPSALESERLAGPDHEQAARDYVAAGARMAAVKLGHEGCVVATGTGVTFVPAQTATRSAVRSRQLSPRAAALWKRHGWPCEPEHTWRSIPAPSRSRRAAVRACPRH